MLSRHKSRIDEEEAASTLPDYVLEAMLEERTIERHGRSSYQRRSWRWGLLAIALLVSMLAAAIIALP